MKRQDVSLSMIALNAAQQAVLAWVVGGCAPGVYSNDSFAHRITARALESRGLIEIRGHGASWRAVPTERGRRWPQATSEDDEERRQHARREKQRSRKVTTELGEPDVTPDTVGRALRRMPRRQHGARPLPVKKVNKQESYMRYKVVVTRVQVAERWIRATDEEDAARKVQEEFAKPYSYFGSWETKGSEVEVIEAEQTTIIRPNLLDESGPMMLTLKDAAGALGVPYSALYELTNRGDIEYTRIGSRKYISREALMSFIHENTHRGYTSI